MRGKPIVPRDKANRDIDTAVDCYLSEAGEETALAFIGAVERAHRHIARRPASASPRYGHELNLPALRAWPLKRYPYSVFYVERDDGIDIWRILRGERDIPHWMRAPEDA